ncbi:MAG: 2OG-Fe(II) oxygenase [Steroidobacteraceae bacterium]
MENGWLERARQFDATGQHDEAINELARGTKSRDPESTRALGLRLLTGEAAPLLPERGLEFLGEAVDAGLPEAAARAAAVLALGVRVAPNWSLGLAWLRRSAEAGWAPAQRQLLALCDDRELAADAARRSAIDWARIAGAIRLDDWRRAPAPVIRHDEPRVATFPDLVRTELCAELIGYATGRLEAARVYDPVSHEDIVIAHRSNTIATFDVNRAEFVHALLQARMSAACGVPDRWMEAPSVLHYSPGEQIREHYDFVNPSSSPDYTAEIARNGQRIITFILYLNEDYDGGETDFPTLSLTHKGSRGEGIYFVNTLPDHSPDLRMIHAGRPTTRGEKWIITQFVRGRPTR